MNTTKPKLILGHREEHATLGGYCSTCYEPFYGPTPPEDAVSDKGDVVAQFERHLRLKHPFAPKQS